MTANIRELKRITNKYGFTVWTTSQSSSSPAKSIHSAKLWAVEGHVHLRALFVRSAAVPSFQPLHSALDFRLLPIDPLIPQSPSLHRQIGVLDLKNAWAKGAIWEGEKSIALTLSCFFRRRNVVSNRAGGKVLHMLKKRNCYRRAALKHLRM